MSSVTRARELRPDQDGNFRPYIGYKWPLPGEAKGKQCRFNLGRDKKEAERRYHKIQELYEQDCSASGKEHWSIRGLGLAKAIAKGEQRYEVFPPGHQDLPNSRQPHEPHDYFQRTERLRQQYPSVEVMPADPEKYKASAEANEDYVSRVVREKMAELEERLLGEAAISGKGKLPNRLISGSLHEAMNAYEQSDIRRHNVEPDGSLSAFGFKRLDRVKLLKERHKDVPLYSLNFDSCDAMIAYWENRPQKREGEEIMAEKSCQNVIKELRRFFRWLDATDQFRWEMQRSLNFRRVKIKRLAHERKLSALSKEVYSVEELATLNKYATPLERLALLVGLNCAMGAAEAGRLVMEDIHQSEAHPYGRQLGIASSKEDSWIRFLRPKTQVFGEWYIWPETLTILQWGMARAQKYGSDILFCSEKGKPLYRGNTNPQQRFHNLWNHLVERVQKHERGFRYLPFGTLRDTIPNILRERLNGGEVLASMATAHGCPYKGDNLLDCYSNKPWARFHKALRKLHQHFKPVFKATDDPTYDRRHRAEPQKDTIKAMLADGKPVKEIVAATGVSTWTIYAMKNGSETS
jgi:hypothetical protein